MGESTSLFGNTPTTFLLFPLIAAACVIISFVSFAVSRIRRREEVPTGELLWALLSVALLGFVGFWCSTGYVNSPETYWIQASVALAVLGSVAPLRERLFSAIDALEGRSALRRGLIEALRIARDAALLFIASEFARLALEFPSNTDVYSLPANSVVVEISIVFLLSAFAYFVFQRRAAGPALVVLACYFAGLAEHFVIEFKQNAILPMELFALGTAAEVSGQYTYVLTPDSVRALVYVALALLTLSLIRPGRMRGRVPLATSTVGNFACALACAWGLTFWVTGINYHEDLGLTISYWNSPNTYRRQGMIPSFLCALEDMPLKVPEGYDHEEAEQLVKAHAAATDALPERTERRRLAERQYRQVKPSLVIIMNETFADLSRLEGLRAGYEGPTFFKSMADCVRRGQIAVSVYGAGTCNTEFEVLTANSLAFLGAGKYPYQMFDLEGASNLARQFKDQGYSTLAIHPNAGANWNRNTVYADFGFDRFLSTDNDFEGAPGFHNGFTDKSTYERIIESLKRDAAPQFVFDVTMQNHGGYEVGNIPPERLTDFQPEGFDPALNAQLNEYLSCIQASDEDLEWFVGELEALERPVVLVFFGDHHPKFSNEYNDVFFDPNLESEVEHAARIYQTDYVIWANYDVAGTDQVSEDEPVGTDCLGALTLDLMGAPLEDFQKAQLDIHRRLLAISAVGYEGTDGRWHTPGTTPYLDSFFDDMARMDYLRFGEDIR